MAVPSQQHRSEVVREGVANRKIEKKMSQVQAQYKKAQENYGSQTSQLAGGQGLLDQTAWQNDAVKSYITRHEPEPLEYFELAVNTVTARRRLCRSKWSAYGEFE